MDTFPRGILTSKGNCLHIVVDVNDPKSYKGGDEIVKFKAMERRDE